MSEPASRVRTRYVWVMAPQQQAWQGLHRLREDYEEERTACINGIRGLQGRLWMLSLFLAALLLFRTQVWK